MDINMNLKRITLWTLALSLCLFQGCAGPIGPAEDLSNTKQYNGFVGRTFRLQRDCYVYVYKDEKSELPFVCDNNHEGALPEVVKSDYVGQNINGLTILGILKIGAKFRLESVYKQNVISDTTSADYYFVISLEGTEQARWPKLNAIYLTDYNTPDLFKRQPMLPMFLPKYVE
jgi:hypothetical protein